MRLVPIVLGLLSGLAVSPGLAAPVTLSGQVTYRERIALPDPATLEIQLIDQSVPGLPPRLDVRAPIATKGGVPLSFSLGFDGAMILPNHSYALIAAISGDSGLLFRNFEPYVVNPLAPAAPVVIVTNFVGHIEAPSSMSPTPDAPSPPAILDSIWTATTIGDTPVLPRTRPSITIGADMRAGGSGGCNAWFAQAELDGDTIRLGSITSTQRGCTQSINLQEQAFKSALAGAATWQVSGDQLTLFAADGKTLLVYVR